MVRRNTYYIFAFALLFFALFIFMGVKTVSAAEISALDTDHDGLIDEVERSIHRTDPNKPDTDGDGYLDGEEVSNGYSPRYNSNKKMREVDSDSDGLNDDWEIALGTDLLKPDSDGDGFKDGHEVMRGYDPTNKAPRKLEKKLEVSLEDQKLKVLFGSTKLDEFLISSGVVRTPTPVGNFTILQKRPVVNYRGARGVSYPNTKWNLVFKRGNGFNYYIHSAWWHNDFGRPKSAGCVNVPATYEYMGRIYDWADVGTKVHIVG